MFFLNKWIKTSKPSWEEQLVQQISNLEVKKTRFIFIQLGKCQRTQESRKKLPNYWPVFLKSRERVKVKKESMNANKQKKTTDLFYDFSVFEEKVAKSFYCHLNFKNKLWLKLFSKILIDSISQLFFYSITIVSAIDKIEEQFQSPNQLIIFLGLLNFFDADNLLTKKGSKQMF